MRGLGRCTDSNLPSFFLVLSGAAAQKASEMALKGAARASQRVGIASEGVDKASEVGRPERGVEKNHPDFHCPSFVGYRFPLFLMKSY